MAYGHFDGKDISNPELRKQFDREQVIKSDWYLERLKQKQQKDVAFCKKQINYLTQFMQNPDNASLVVEMNIPERIEKAQNNLKEISSEAYFKNLIGTIGIDPLFKK